MPKHPKKILWRSLNDFILERIDYDTPNSKSVVVIGGCGEANVVGRNFLFIENICFCEST